MSAARPRLATAEDLEALPEDHRVEVIGGALVQKASPSFEHGDAQSSIAGLIKPRYQHGRGGPGGWRIATEVEIELSANDVFVPDVVGWKRERTPERPRGRPIRIRPDWVCEVLSVSNALNDLGIKLAAYHRTAVPHHWIVDPERETLTVHRSSSDGYLVVLSAGRGETVHAEPFEELPLLIDDLFGGA
ncbi:MAG: Uma2 family endonuclease [Labilithrix sp.]|nr:Uma2 family endonuclease [Labilithrix sp.]